MKRWTVEVMDVVTPATAHGSGETGGAEKPAVAGASKRTAPAQWRRVRREGNKSAACSLLLHLYGHFGKRMRNLILSAIRRLESDEIYSVTLRRLFERYFEVSIGMYTHGGCFVPGSMPAGTRIGRYCSIAVTAQAFSLNHPMELKSSHGLFFNPLLGLVQANNRPRTRLVIGNDVWIGHNAIILPSVSSIGDGAVIGAGAVVHKNIPPYAVVIGHPCRIVRYRFSRQVIDSLLASRWWEKTLDELRPELESFQTPLEAPAEPQDFFSSTQQER